MKWDLRLLFTLGLLATSLSLVGGDAIASDAELSQIRQEYLQAKRTVSAHFDGFSVDGDPDATSALDREWSLLSEWVAQLLNTSKHAGAKEIKSAIHSLDPDLGSEAIELDHHTYVVAARDNEFGTVWLVSREANTGRVAWSIKDYAAEQSQAGNISNWSAKNASWNHGRRSGPLYATLGKLPSDANGNPRFYIDGTYAQWGGGTLGGQLSIWEWNGSNVNLLMAKEYLYYLDGGEISLHGELLQIHTKETFKTFFSCEECGEPDAEWTIRVSRQGVDDLGSRRLVPELDLVDELFARLENNASIADIAAPDVVTSPSVDAIREQLVSDPGQFSAGMLDGWKIKRIGSDSRLCVSLDVGRYVYSFSRPDGQLHLTGIIDADYPRYGETCTAVLKNSFAERR